jgi:hypothetical protein
MASQKAICYLSAKCPWSIAFLKELDQTSFKNEVKLVCVDPSPNRPPLPSFLKKVPTLVVAGDPEPKTDSEVMNWLSIRKLQTQAIRARPPAPGVSAPSQVQQSLPSEPEPFIFSEMGGAGQDPYSFIDQDTSTAGNGGMRIAHNFEFLGGPLLSQGGGGEMPPAMGQKKSKKEEMFDAQMEAYQRDRESGMPQARPRQ